MMTDPSSYLNQLRTLMGFYDQNGLGGPVGSQTGFAGAQNLATNSGDRLNFALQMMDRMQRPTIGFQQPPKNYFDFSGQSAPQGPGVPNYDPIEIARNTMARAIRGRY